MSLNFKNVPARRWARFAAIQALYEIEMSGVSVKNITQDFKHRRFKNCFTNMLDLDEQYEKQGIDEEFFNYLVETTQARKDYIVSVISEKVDKKEFKNLEKLIKAILCLGAFEIIYCDEIPKSVSISEYVALSDLFFNEDEPSLINAVLDKINP